MHWTYRPRTKSHSSVSMQNIRIMYLPFSHAFTLVHTGKGDEGLRCMIKTWPENACSILYKKCLVNWRWYLVWVGVWEVLWMKNANQNLKFWIEHWTVLWSERGIYTNCVRLIKSEAMKADVITNSLEICMSYDIEYAEASSTIDTTRNIYMCCSMNKLKIRVWKCSTFIFSEFLMWMIYWRRCQDAHCTHILASKASSMTII